MSRYFIFIRNVIMAGNRRGKLKEHFEGIHRNFDWVQYHCEKMLDLIRDDNPKLSDTICHLSKAVEGLDEISHEVYHKL